MRRTRRSADGAPAGGNDAGATHRRGAPAREPEATPSGRIPGRLPDGRLRRPDGEVARSLAEATVGVAVDVVPYALRDGRLVAGLVAVREGDGSLKAAFPGGRVRAHESLDDAAARWLARGLPGESAHLEQLYTFGEPGRDPAARVVSVAYLALLPRAADVPGIAWHPADDLPPLAYDHDAVARVALARLRAKLGYTNVAYSLLPERFTLAELQHLYEAVLGRSLDRRNFRKRLLASGLLVPLAAARRGAHRPARLYRFAEQRPITIAVLGGHRAGSPISR
jgi:8-oxo-dGTP diphosphatase